MQGKSHYTDEGHLRHIGNWLDRRRDDNQATIYISPTWGGGHIVRKVPHSILVAITIHVHAKNKFLYEEVCGILMRSRRCRLGVGVRT